VTANVVVAAGRHAVTRFLVRSRPAHQQTPKKSRSGKPERMRRRSKKPSGVAWLGPELASDIVG
jgi:hypothetical protein